MPVVTVFGDEFVRRVLELSRNKRLKPEDVRAIKTSSDLSKMLNIPREDAESVARDLASLTGDWNLKGDFPGNTLVYQPGFIVSLSTILHVDGLDNE